MITVWKYTIETFDSLVKTFEMPIGARPLRVALQERPEGNTTYPIIDMWFLVDTNRTPTKREFSVIGTGHPIRSDMDFGWILTDYVGTVQPQPNLVLHIFETTPQTLSEERQRRSPWLPV